MSEILLFISTDSTLAKSSVPNQLHNLYLLVFAPEFLVE